MDSDEEQPQSHDISLLREDLSLSKCWEFILRRRPRNPNYDQYAIGYDQYALG